MKKTKHAPAPTSPPATAPPSPPATAPPSPSINPDALYRWAQVRQYLPISKAAWYAGVASGRYPQSVKLGPSTTCWRGSDLLKLIQGGTGHE
jgi:predicted DNA-binding transcriptional regulator AlpA